VTSLLKHVSDLDRFETIQKASLAGYAAAVESMAQYAVEIETSLTEKHREYLRAIRVQVMGTGSPEALMDTQSALRAELRDYRDKCGTYLGQLRQEFTSALVSLNEVMSSLSSSGQDQQKHLKTELNTLETLAETSDPDMLRRGVQTAVKTIAVCVDQMKRENDIIVAQFRDEIRTMQSRVEAAEASASLDASTGALKRSEFETRVRRDVLRDGPVCLAIVKVSNFKDLRSRHGKLLAGEAILALYRRTREEFGPEVDIGRWRDEIFTVKLLCAKQDALKCSRDPARHVSGAYVCMEEGSRHTLQLKVNVGIADLQSCEEGDKFLARVDSLCESLA
jgi:GGDEF domain-containing protein